MGPCVRRDDSLKIPNAIALRLRGRVGVGVPNENSVCVVKAPTRRALSSAIAEAQLRRSYLRTVAGTAPTVAQQAAE